VLQHYMNKRYSIRQQLAWHQVDWNRCHQASRRQLQHITPLPLNCTIISMPSAQGTFVQHPSMELAKAALPTTHVQCMQLWFC
jgi:hypothetical protein